MTSAMNRNRYTVSFREGVQDLEFFRNLSVFLYLYVTEDLRQLVTFLILETRAAFGLDQNEVDSLYNPTLPQNERLLRLMNIVERRYEL